jgi:hypothetical protein
MTKEEKAFIKERNNIQDKYSNSMKRIEREFKLAMEKLEAKYGYVTVDE